MNFEKLHFTFTHLYLRNYAGFRECLGEEQYCCSLLISNGMQNLGAVAQTVPQIFKKNENLAANFNPKYIP